MQLSKRNQQFNQQKELENMLANATASTGRNDPDSTDRSKKGPTVIREEGMKEGRSTCSSVGDIQKGTTARYDEVKEIKEGKLSSLYGSVT